MTIQVIAPDEDSGAPVIPADSLLARVHANGHRSTAWQQVPDLAELADGEIGGFRVASGGLAAAHDSRTTGTN